MVVAMAKALGWLCYHTYDARRCEPGFPDLVMLRPPRLVFAELKTARGRVKAAQQTWLDALRAAGAEAYLWRPGDADEVEAALRAHQLELRESE